MNLERTLYCLLCCCLASASFAQKGTNDKEELPSLELLMYLGEWQDNDGQAINPQNYRNEDAVLNMKTTDKMNLNQAVTTRKVDAALETEKENSK